jgi:hypothetical protein
MMIENKSEIVPLRLTPTQKRLVRGRARLEGVRLTTWQRELALSHAVGQRERGGEGPLGENSQRVPSRCGAI